MNLRDISYAMRAAADVASAGENLLVSMARSRRGGAGPLLFGVAVGIGIGALVFKKETRQRIREWVGLTTIAPAGSTNGAAAEPQVASDAAPH
jgi:hypothetical protein